MASKDRKPEPAAQLLADNITHLEHPTNGRTMRLVDFQGQGAKQIRLEIAESILHLLRSEGHMPPPKKRRSEQGGR